MFKCRTVSKIFERRFVCAKLKHVWTDSKIVKSSFKDAVIPDVPLHEYLWSNTAQWPNKVALVCGVTNRQYTYNEIYKQSRVFGANLRKKFGIEVNDRVVLMMPNIPEYATVVLGVLSAGGVVTTLNPIYTPYEVKKQLLMATPKVAVAIPATVPTLQEAFKQSNISLPIIVIDTFDDRPENTVSYKELVQNDINLDVLKNVKRNPHDTSFLLYSSGTTGLPKGVELTNKNMVSNCAQHNGDAQIHIDTSEFHQDTVLAYLPFFHCYGLMVTLLHKLSVGLKIVTLPRFQPNTFLDALNAHNFDLLFMAPPTVLFLATDSKVKSKYFGKLRSAITAAAPTAIPDIQFFLNKVNREIHFGQAYGLTEASALVTISPRGSTDYTSVGKAVPNVECRVIDSQSNNLGPNELGELIIKGPNIMKGYRNNKEANNQVFIDKDWLRTGDLAQIDEFGTVTIVDRLKELIKVNAYQVPPAELESLIKEHPAVLDAAVIAIPDSMTGEKPKAYVVLNKGIQVTEKDILNYVTERVAPYKRLKEVKFVESIHKNPTGKIMRRLLLEEHLRSQR